MRCPRRSPDDRGAIMLIALFFAIFGVAMLYYAIGVGQAVLFREKLQDASDAAALSAAIMHARGMNLIVLINIIMAALLAVLVTIKLIQALCTIGIALAAGLAWCTFGATLVAIPPLGSINQAMQSAYDTFHDPVFEALKILHETADIVSEAAPLVADALSVADIATNTELPGLKGAAFSMQKDLPVGNDTFPELCSRAGRFPIQLAKGMLEPLPGVSEFLGELESPMGDLTRALSEWFCGDDVSYTPSRDQKVKSSYPRTQSAIDCRNSQPKSGSTDPAFATSPECDDSQRDERDAEPDKITGNCQVGHNCELGGPYDAHVALARQQCNPSVASMPISYIYQLRTANVEYRWSKGQWVRNVVSYGTPSNEKSDGRYPCGFALAPFMLPIVSSEYNTVVRKSSDVNEVLPVCSNESALLGQSAFWDKTQPQRLKVTEVSQILGCIREENVHVDLSGGKPADKSDRNKRSPKRVLSSAKQWGDEFQLRAFLMADSSSNTSEGIIRLSLWNQAAPTAQSALLRELGRFAVTQAEYFYNGPQGRDDWMWNMKWRARLRRFHMPQNALSGLSKQICGVMGDTCESLLGPLPMLEDAIAH